MKKAKDKKITIEVDLPIPLEEIQNWMGELDENIDLIKFLESKSKLITYIPKSILSDFLKDEKVDVEILKIKYGYYDSSNLSHGMVYFEIKIRGTKQELKKIAGEDKLFIYEWNN